MQWILESILAGYVAGVLCAPVASLSRMVWLGFWLVLFLTSIWLVKTHPRQALWTIAALFFATGAIRHDQVSSIPEHDISKFANTFAVVAGEPVPVFAGTGLSPPAFPLPAAAAYYRP